VTESNTFLSSQGRLPVISSQGQLVTQSSRHMVTSSQSTRLRLDRNINGSTEYLQPSHIVITGCYLAAESLVA